MAAEASLTGKKELLQYLAKGKFFLSAQRSAARFSTTENWVAVDSPSTHKEKDFLMGQKTPRTAVAARPKGEDPNAATCGACVRARKKRELQNLGGLQGEPEAL